jgi:hypothetical protein
MDTIGWYLATLHQMLGHRAAAAVLGQPVQEGEQADCILCKFEKGEATREEVEQRIGESR